MSSRHVRDKRRGDDHDHRHFHHPSTDRRSDRGKASDLKRQRAKSQDDKYLNPRRKVFITDAPSHRRKSHNEDEDEARHSRRKSHEESHSRKTESLEPREKSPPPTKVCDRRVESKEPKKREKDKKPSPPSPPPAKPKSPLLAFIERELTKDTKFVPCMKGPFSRDDTGPEQKGATDIEFLAEKTLQLLTSNGFDQSTIYDLATLSGRKELKSQLKPVFATAMNKDNNDKVAKKVRSQAHKIIRLLIKYFLDEPDSSETSEEEEEEEKELGCSAPEPGKLPTLQQQPPPAAELPSFNPWGQVENEFKAELEQSFDKVKEHLSKDLMKLGHSGGNGTLNPFEVANEVVGCFASVRHTLPSLKLLVAKYGHERVLPDADTAPPAPLQHGRRRGQQVKPYYLYHDLLPRLDKVRPAKLPRELMEHCLRKTLAYIVRGDKQQQQQQQQDKPPPPINNLVWNHLPPGLREQEEVNAALKDKDLMAPEGITVSYEDDDMEETMSKARGGVLPDKKYLVGSVYVEWLTVDGKPHVVEVHVHFPNISDLSLYVVSREMAKQTDLLTQFNFALNPDKNLYFYVQAGCSSVEAGSLRYQTRKLVTYLESVRRLSGENANNGLVLLFRGMEEASLWSDLLQKTACEKQLVGEVIKGYGTLEDVMSANRGLAFLRPEAVEAFYHAQAWKGREEKSFTSKTKAESLLQALEFYLEPQPVDYANFIQPYCFHPKGVMAVEMVEKFGALVKFFKFEKYLASKLEGSTRFKDDICNDFRCRTMTSPAEVAAYRFCKMLVELDVDLNDLEAKFQQGEKAVSLADEYKEVARSHEIDLLVGRNSHQLHGAVQSFFKNIV